jgi:23S rRNA (cytosine1962-C5)-methyltransferase
VAQVKISSRGAKRIRRGHLWVYRSDIDDAESAAGGDIARVVDQTGNFVGTPFIATARSLRFGS